MLRHTTGLSGLISCPASTNGNISTLRFDSTIIKRWVNTGVYPPLRPWLLLINHIGNRIWNSARFKLGVKPGTPVSSSGCLRPFPKWRPKPFCTYMFFFIMCFILFQTPSKTTHKQFYTILTLVEERNVERGKSSNRFMRATNQK